MEHEDFPVAGFEFMNEPATDEQKRIIIELVSKLGLELDHSGEWPNPFTKWDAANMIDALRSSITDVVVFDDKNKSFTHCR